MTRFVVTKNGEFLGRIFIDGVEQRHNGFQPSKDKAIKYHTFECASKIASMRGAKAIEVS